LVLISFANGFTNHKPKSGYKLSAAANHWLKTSHFWGKEPNIWSGAAAKSPSSRSGAE